MEPLLSIERCKKSVMVVSPILNNSKRYLNN